MRIALLSDLHVDMIPRRHRRAIMAEIADCMRARAIDVVVVAGDVASRMGPILDTLPILAVGRLANLYVPGNHDVWRTEHERDQGRTSFGGLTLLASRIAGTGFHYLPGSPIVVSEGPDRVGFAGMLGWYDYGFADPALGIPEETYRAKQWRNQTWQDRDHATWVGYGGRWWADREVCAYFLAGLERDLRALGLDEQGGGPPTIAVSHMLPFVELVYRDPDPEEGFFAAYLGSPLHGALLERFPAIRAAFAGHTHRPQRNVRPSGMIAAVAPFGNFGEADFPENAIDRIGWFEMHGGRIVERRGSELVEPADAGSAPDRAATAS